MPRRARRLGTVEGALVSHALANPLNAVFLERDEHERAVVNPSKAGLEETDERKAQQAQLDPLDSHATMLSQSLGAFAILR